MHLVSQLFLTGVHILGHPCQHWTKVLRQEQESDCAGIQKQSTDTEIRMLKLKTEKQVTEQCCPT